MTLQQVDQHHMYSLRAPLFLVQLLRIFVPNRKANKTLFLSIWVIIGVNFCFYFMDIIFEIILCLPREKICNPLLTSGRCLNALVLYKATGMFNVVSDLAILIIPMFPIWELQMPLGRKFKIAGVFASGILSVRPIYFSLYSTCKTRLILMISVLASLQ